MYCIPPPLPPPSVGPSVRVATARSGFFSLVTYLRTCRRYSSGPPDRWWWSVDIFAAERTYKVYKKKGKRKYGSLCLDAHKFRTPLVLKVHGSAPLHHTTNLHYTTCLYLLLLLRRQRCRMFQIQDVCFSAVPCSYPRHTVYLTTIMPPCKEEGRRQARQQYLTYLTLLELGGSSSNYICTSDGTRKGTKRKKKLFG